MATRKGLTPKNRKITEVERNANQWLSTPKQNKFMELWLDPASATFGNAYKSAILAGYGRGYAVQIASPAVNNKWVQEYKKRLNLTEEHIKQGISKLAIRANNSRSPDDTKLKAYETLAKIHNLGGYSGGKGSTTNILVQPILSGASIRKPLKIDSEVVNTDHDIDTP